VAALGGVPVAVVAASARYSAVATAAGEVFGWGWLAPGVAAALYDGEGDGEGSVAADGGGESGDGLFNCPAAPATSAEAIPSAAEGGEDGEAWLPRKLELGPSNMDSDSAATHAIALSDCCPRVTLAGQAGWPGGDSCCGGWLAAVGLSGGGWHMAIRCELEPD
jgi:hypothetical protein